MVTLTDIQDNSELTDKEKILLLRNNQITTKNIIPNIGNYLADNFEKVDGFDYRWSSLITSKPLLFEDTDYLRVKPFIDENISQTEINAYKAGELRELYATFESMLICNLQYYDRIMSFCTMIFLHYIRLSDSNVSKESLDDIPYIFEMTPTQIWCCAMSNTQSTKFELEYAWNVKIITIQTDKSLLENNWKTLYQNKIFAKFIQYSAIRCNTNGFRETLISDKTSNRKLAQVCSKFTRTSTAISEDSLSTIYEYVKEIQLVEIKLYSALYSCLMRIFNDSDKFAIYIYSNDFYLHTAKFSMRVSKSKDGRITKDYLGNTFECFAAEAHLVESVKYQIEWAKYQLPIQYEYEKNILYNLLAEMIKDSNYKNIICIKRMNEYGILSKITFSGIFANLYITEEFMFENRVIKVQKKCLSRQNAARYIIDRGYFIFGIESDVYQLAMTDILSNSILTKHYTNYCVPVMKHMSAVMTLYTFQKNDIIDVVCSGILNPNKLNNDNIKFTNIKGDSIKPKHLLNDIMQKQAKFENKKTYWKVIEN